MKNLIFIFCLLILLVTGCSKNDSANVVTNHSLTSKKLTEVLFDNDIVTMNVFIPDVSYALPFEKWIKTQYSKTLYDYLQSFKTATWKPEENDCDNFASMSFSLAQMLHHTTANKIKNTALAFGEFWYIQDSTKSGHAINIFVTYSDTNIYKIYFFEPQSQFEITLSQTEKDSCYFCRF
jgi:hypothetical protein